jgi:hypothetical protein
MISATIKNSINFPKLLLQDDLKYIADKIIIKDIKKYMDDERSLLGQNYNKLAESTIKVKKRFGLSTKILRATGKLRNSFIYSKIGSGSIKITLNQERKDIGNILQNEGVRTKSGKRYFEFFGINAAMENKAILYMKEKIKRLIRNG